MAKHPDQKAKIIHIYKMLFEQTDEEHTLTVNDMIYQLSLKGIKAERKSIYDDLKVLRELGCDIIGQKAKTYNYYMASRKFQLPELKLIIDAVAAARFLSPKKTEALVEGLTTLASDMQKEELLRNSGIYSNVKTKNEAVYYNIDSINKAIQQNKAITFEYFDYDIHKNKLLRDGGGDNGRYTVIPHALIWEDESYYLVCHYEKYGTSQFKVHKMQDIQLFEQEITEDLQKEDIDLQEYIGSMFNMFKGEPVRAEIKFDNSLLNVVFDRFGMDVDVQALDDNHFIAHLDVSISPTFIAWLFNFGNKAQVLSPGPLVKEIKDTLKDFVAIYF